MDLTVFDPTLFAIYFVACAAAGATGGAFPPGDWYETLSKPSWTPPDWLFPVAWTVLYLAMSLTGMRVSLALEGVGGEAVSGVARYAPALWALQIALNTLWTPIFFGLQRIGGALVVIGCGPPSPPARPCSSWWTPSPAGCSRPT